MPMTGMVGPAGAPACLRMSGMLRAETLLPSAVYAVLAIANSVAAGKSGSTAARRLRFVLKGLVLGPEPRFPSRTRERHPWGRAQVGSRARHTFRVGLT